MSISQMSVEVQKNIKLSIFCLTWIWQDFVIVLQNTPCPVCHPTMACLVHWCCWAVLPDGVIQHSFYKNRVIFILVCMSVGRILSRGALVDFFKSFSKGAKSGKIWFLPLTTKKTAFFAEIFKFLSPLRHPCLCVEKSSCHSLNNWCNFKRFNTIPNMKFCWILYAKLNFWQIKFSCVFVFALATLNSNIYFCIGNKIGILTDNLLVATYALSCPCIPVSHAVVEWFFSHVISVFKMRKSCDFECV